MFFAACLHTSGQFEIIRLHLEEITAASDSASNSDRLTKKFNEDENEQLNKKLKGFIEIHNEVLEACDLMSRTFAPIIFLHLVAASILICSSCLMLFLAPGAEKSIFLNFLLGTFLDVFVHTYVGTLIIEKSTKIQQAAYNFDWYRCDVKNQKLILMILVRTRNAAAVKIPFFSASLGTFITVKRLNRSL